MRFRFGDHPLDVKRRGLRRQDELLALEPQVEYALRNRERVVSKDDLIEHIWRGRIVSDAALTTRLNAARKTVGDSDAAHAAIRRSPARASAWSRTLSRTFPSRPSPLGASWPFRAKTT